MGIFVGILGDFVKILWGYWGDFWEFCGYIGVICENFCGYFW